MKRLLGFLAVVVTSHAASADRTADKLFREGKALVKAGKLAEACDAFERSDRIEPRVGTLLNLANCRELQGRSAAAWALFLEAKVRAVFTLEPRAEFAAQRVADLERALGFLTLEVAPDQAVGGLVIERAGVVVSPSTWNTPVPLDPAEYTVEARAPGRVAWSITRALKPGDRISITIGPLAASTPADTMASTPAVATIEPPPASDLPRDRIAGPTRAEPLEKRRYLAVGAALGVAAGNVSSAPDASPEVLEDDHVPIGLRLLGSFSVPRGAVRGIGSVLYTKGLNDKTDATNTKKLYVIGLGADYVFMPRPRLAFAAGVGVGWDYEVRSFGGGTDLARWEALRASPIIVRLANGAVELGVHTQLIRRGDGLGFIGVAAVDVFLL